jgi:hypothetical protein
MMHIKKIETDNPPFVPFHLMIGIDCPSDYDVLHSIFHDYLTRYASHDTPQTKLCNSLIITLNK